MSRTYNANVANYLSAGAAAITTAPVSMAAWVRLAGDTIFARTIISFKNTATDNTSHYFRLTMNGDETISASTADAAAAVHSTTTGVVTVGVWAHVAAVFASATSRIVYLNGVAATEETTSRTPAGIDDMFVGVHSGSEGPSNAWYGEIGEVAIYNAALSGADVLALAGGACPDTIENLVHLWHIKGDSPELDSVLGNNLTVTGTLPASEPAPAGCFSAQVLAARRTQFKAGELYNITTR